MATPELDRFEALLAEGPERVVPCAVCGEIQATWLIRLERCCEPEPNALIPTCCGCFITALMRTADYECNLCGQEWTSWRESVEQYEAL